MLGPYIEGSRFTVRTDHEALRWILYFMKSSRGLDRWLQLLMKFNFDTQHRFGWKKMIADGLWRLSCELMNDTDLDKDLAECYIEHFNAIIMENAVTDIVPDVTAEHDEHNAPHKPPIDVILEEQKKDSLCQDLFKQLDDTDSLYLPNQHGILSRRYRPDGSTPQVIPAILRSAILYHSLDPWLAGHTGRRQMYDTTRRFFYFPHMAKDV